MGNRRTLRAAAVLAAGVGCVLMATGLGVMPGGEPTVASRWLQPGLPATDATWVAADGTAEPDGRLRAGDVHGGAVTYVKFEVPATTPAAFPTPPRLQLTSVAPLPELVELVAVPHTDWQASQLDWQSAPTLGSVVQSVQPSRLGNRVSFDVGGVVNGPGTYAFAVTVPPDLGHATFVGADGSPRQPTLHLPGFYRIPAGDDPYRPTPAVSPGPAIPPPTGLPSAVDPCKLGDPPQPTCGAL